MQQDKWTRAEKKSRCDLSQEGTLRAPTYHMPQRATPAIRLRKQPTAVPLVFAKQAVKRQGPWARGSEIPAS